MNARRIRCECGRVYQPAKHAACPACGAPAPITEIDLPGVETDEPKEQLVRPAPQLAPEIEATKPTAGGARMIMIGAGFLLAIVVLILLFRGCGHREPARIIVPEPTPTASPGIEPTAVPSATVVVIPPARETAPPQQQTVFAQPFDLAAAVANAAPGATVKIPPGMYSGGLVVDKSIRLVGVAGQVYLQSEGRECLTVRAPGVAVQNVQFNCSGIGELPAISLSEKAELELEACKIQSSTTIGVTVGAGGSLKTLGCTFTVNSGLALRLNQNAHGNLTQTSFADSYFGLWLAAGATAELHSCAFERDGGQDAKGVVLSVNGAGSAVTADDCHFSSNTAGLSVADGGSLGLTNCSFRENGSNPRNLAVTALIAVRNHSSARLTNDLFDQNQQGVSIVDGSTLDMEKCQFTGSGVSQMRDVLPVCQPISVTGKDAVANVRHTGIIDSAQYAAVAMAGAKILLEGVDISRTRSAGLVVGDRSAGPATGEVRGSRFQNNGTGVGVFAGSSATVEGSELLENQDGIIVLDKDSRLRGNKLTVTGNRDCGVYVHAAGEMTVTDSDFQNNTRGAVSGTRGRSSDRASLTLENCRFSGNRTFAAGAAAQSELNLEQCSFDGSDKLNVWKERSAIVRTDAPPTPSPTASASASPGAETEASPAGVEETPATSPSPGASITPSPSPQRRPRPQKSRRRPESDAERILRRIFRPN